MDVMVDGDGHRRLARLLESRANLDRLLHRLETGGPAPRREAAAP